jgi:hypothetical protein
MQPIILGRDSYKDTQTLEFNLYHGTSGIENLKNGRDL